MPSPTNTGAVGTQPERPPGTAHPHMDPASSPTGSPAPQLQTPRGASTHGHQPATSRAAATQAPAEPRPRHGTPDQLTEGPAYAPPEDPPTQARAATLTDTTSTWPADTVQPPRQQPHQGPKSPGSGNTQHSDPGGPACKGKAELASQRHHAPPGGPAVRPAELSSPSCPAPKPGTRSRPGTHRRPG